jgi:hypothetical protein
MLLNNAINANKKEAERLGIDQKVGEFQTAFEKYREASKNLAHRLVARQAAYLKLGQQLDIAVGNGRRSSKRRRRKRGAPKERFATVMLVTSAIREVYALSRGAKAGFMSPKQFAKWYIEFERERIPFDVSAEEQAPIYNLYSQLSRFHNAVDNQKKLFEPVEEEAGKMMKTLTHESEEAAPY